MNTIASRAVGCAALLFILGLGAFILPLFGYQFRAVSSLEKDWGISMPMAGGTLIGVAILLGFGAALFNAFAESPTPTALQTTTPDVLQRVIPFLPEVSRRLRQGDDIKLIAHSIAARAQVTPEEATLAIKELGPAARQFEKPRDQPPPQPQP